MELWRELLISGLQNENYKFDFINDEVVKEMVKQESYKVLLQIKQAIDNKDCFIKIEEIMCVLEKNNIFCDRHDFG